MGDFARIFHDPERGQILATLDESEEGFPGVKISTMPGKLGVCSLAYYANNREDASWEMAQKALDDMTVEQALSIAGPLFEFAKEEG